MLHLHRERADATQVGVQVHGPARARRVPRQDARDDATRPVPRVRGAVRQHPSRIVVVGVEPCSKGGAVLGAVMIAIVLLGCAINTVLVCCCSDRKLLTRDEQVNYFVSILMTSVGVALVAFVGRECVATGPRALARSMLVRKRSVRVCVSKDLPVEVALPPRIGASAFVNCAIYSTL